MLINPTGAMSSASRTLPLKAATFKLGPVEADALTGGPFLCQNQNIGQLFTFSILEPVGRRAGLKRFHALGPVQAVDEGAVPPLRFGRPDLPLYLCSDG